MHEGTPDGEYILLLYNRELRVSAIPQDDLFRVSTPIKRTLQ